MNPVAKMLIDMARFYGYELEERQLEMYVGVLENFDEKLVLKAGGEYITNVKNTRFPIPPHKILESYLPKEIDDDSRAREAAARIIQAIKKFGYMEPAGAKEFIGELGWGVVERRGGWQTLCENLMENEIGIFQAQARDLLKGHLQLDRAGKLNQPIGLPSSAHSEVITLVSQLAKQKSLPGSTDDK